MSSQKTTYQQNLQAILKLIERVGFNNLEDFSASSGISLLQLYRLLYGLLPRMDVEVLLQLVSTLKISLNDLIDLFYPKDQLSFTLTNEHKEQLEQGRLDELAKLQEQLQKNEQNYQIELAQTKENFKQEYLTLRQQFEDRQRELQRSAFYTLESMLIQLPIVTSAIQQNPDFPSVKLLPLFKPLTQLLSEWDIEPIGSVGAEVIYHPKYHEVSNGEATEGDQVIVTYIGYQQGDQVLYRAKVSQIFES
jgi:hypothetical protein